MTFVWDEVQAAAAANPSLVVLDDAAAHDLAERVRQTFVADARANWWWESLRGKSEWLHYDDLFGGLELLRARIEPEPAVNLLVTDDEPEPHGVVAGAGEAILACSQRCRSLSSQSPTRKCAGSFSTPITTTWCWSETCRLARPGGHPMAASRQPGVRARSPRGTLRRCS